MNRQRLLEAAARRALVTDNQRDFIPIHHRAVAERADLRGTPDEDLLDWARTEDRALVTDNQRDFIPIHNHRIASGSDHRGLILTTNRRFPRGQPATTGKLVVALDEFLRTTAPHVARNPCFIHWLQ